MAQMLENLPPSSDVYWEEAHTELREGTEPDDCNHYFYYRSGTEVECEYCHIGFWLGNRTEVIDGHIYRDNEFVI